MGKRKTKMSGELLAWFQKIGARGGKKRASKYDAETLSKWAKKGGRPKKETESAA